MKLPVLLAADGAAWEARLINALDRADHGVVITRRCMDIVELLGVAAAGKARAALIAAALRHLDADAVDRLWAADVVPVAVLPDPGPGLDTAAVEARMLGMGFTHVVPADADPAVVAAVLAQAVRDAESAPARQTGRAFADPHRPGAVADGGPGAAGSAGSVALPAAADSQHTVVDPALDAPPPRAGLVLAVWGPTGAPGRTLVATALADELSRLGKHTLLVDADVYGAAVAPVLGLLDESPGLAAACRHASTGRLDAAALASFGWQVSATLRVLTGIPIAARWPELRPAALTTVLEVARSLADYVVVDCGFCLETDEELSYDTHAPRRNGATLAVLDAADTIFVVGAADPIGMQRLVRGLDALRELSPAAPTRVILNRVRRSAVPGDPAAELTAALERFAGHSPQLLLPLDTAAVDAALASGRTLAEARPTSPLRRALVEFAAGVAEVPVPRARHRRG